VEIFAILEPRSHPRAATGVKFCKAKWTHVPHICAKFDVNWCNELPMWGENADFGAVSKFNTSSLPLCSKPAGKNETSWMEHSI